jgi:hypothetical protein
MYIKICSILLFLLLILSVKNVKAASSCANFGYTPPALPCSIFPSDNVWNRTITDLPVHSKSAQYINRIGPNTTLHPGFASGTWQSQHIGQVYNVASQNQSTYRMDFTDYASESDAGSYPFFPSMVIEGWPVTNTGDRHGIVVQAGACKLYETWHTKPAPNSDGSWSAANGAMWDLNSNLYRPTAQRPQGAPNGWTSADAAGLPILPGIIRYDEASTNSIHHAIRFTLGTSDILSGSWVWPARHTDGSTSASDAVPMGTRLRLKASFSPSSRSITDTKAVAVVNAMKEYGIILADSGSEGSIDIDGNPDCRWDDATMNDQIGLIKASDFEVVDESSIIVNANSMQVRLPGNAPTNTPVPTTSTPTNTPAVTSNPTSTPRVTSNPTITQGTTTSCAKKPMGDADCNGIVNLSDFEIWRQEFTGTVGRRGDFNNDMRSSLIDFEIWRNTYTH